MATLHENDVVRLTEDVPTLWLSRGDVGVVRSVWLSQDECYEVEFRRPGQAPVKASIYGEQLEAVGLASARPRRETAGAGITSRR